MLGPIEDVIAILAFGIAAFAAVLTTRHRSLLYAAVSLALLGLANAILFAVLGQVLVALFHVIIYVGATVIFIIIAVAMFREAPELPRPLIAASAGVVAVLGIILAALLVAAGALPLTGAAPAADVVKVLLGEYWISLLAICLALVATLVGSVIVARRGS